MESNLPELPRTLKKKEASVTPPVLAWFKAHHPFSCAIEIKNTAGNSIPASALADHQRLALKDSKLPHGLIHKLSDEARRKNPYDAFMLKNSAAFVVACFSSYGICLVFDVEDWVGARFDTPAKYVIKL